MLSRILEQVATLLGQGARLPATPAALASIARDGDATLRDYLELDDATLWVALSGWCEAPEPLLRDLARRFRERKLFKTYELFGEHATASGRVRALELGREIAKQTGLDPAVYVGLDAASTIPFDDSDPLMVVFPNGSTRALADVSFLLGRLQGQRMERVRLIFAAELREPLVKALTESRA